MGGDGAAPVKQTVTVSQAQKISDESLADVDLMMARLSTKHDTAVENIDDLHNEGRDISNNVKNLEAAGFRDAGTEKKKGLRRLGSKDSGRFQT